VEYLGFAADLARAAGDILKHYMGREKQIELKGRANLVTIADKESEAFVIRKIHERYPTHAILAEESGASGSGEDGKWIIDPLDGTTNFGEVLCGAVYDPHRDEMFTGSRGQGSFLNGRRLFVSEAAELSSSLLTTGFSYNFRQNIDVAIGQFRRFMVECQAIRRGGSAALDLCYVAMGRCDGFWEMDLHPWDTAAGRVIAEEAGARISDFNGGAFSIYGREVVASNGRIHDEMIQVLARREA
jgi:myo-inositol-1(or 4)-monophosphatase